MPTQCDHYWAGLRCQLRAGHASAHAAREDDALIYWRSDEHGDRVKLDWADRDVQLGPADADDHSGDDHSDDDHSDDDHSDDDHSGDEPGDEQPH